MHLRTNTSHVLSGFELLDTLHSNKMCFLSGIKNSMVVTWSTSNQTESVVEYSLWGEALFSQKAKGNYTVFTDGGTENRTTYIHRVTLTDLRPGSAYGDLQIYSVFSLVCMSMMCCLNDVCVSVYHCGSDAGWSDVFYLTSLNQSLSFSPRFALFGDMGNENPQSLSRLQKETQIGMYDAILHIGENQNTCSENKDLHISQLVFLSCVVKLHYSMCVFSTGDFAYDMHEVRSTLLTESGS